MVRQYITASPQGEHKRETLEAETQLESEDEPTLLDILEDEEDYQDDDGTEEGDQGSPCKALAHRRAMCSQSAIGVVVETNRCEMRKVE